MKTFSQFCLEAYDKDVMGSSQIRKTGEGGRVGADRRKSEPEMRRTKRGPGGTTVPAKRYKTRSDVGSQRSASERQQQPTKERGSAALSAKEAQRKAYLERKAREKGAATKSRDLEKQASKLLTKKKAAAPTSGPIERTTKKEYTRDEKKKMVRAGKRLHKDIIKGREKDASHYTP
jgi:hypothetical protein